VIKQRMTIKEKDIGWKKFRNEMKKVKGSFVTIGVHNDAGQYADSDVTAAEVALWNEFGTDRKPKGIPQRSFLRSTYDERLNDLNILRGRALDKISKGEMSVKDALENIGQFLANMVMKKIQSNIPPENAPSTIEAKEREGVTPIRTLYHTGLLERSIGYKAVVK